MAEVIGIPPAVNEETRAYWEAAREGRLLLECCTACGAEAFPPRSICRKCRSRQMRAIEARGPGHIYSFTINHQRWLPGLYVPFAIVLVEFEHHPGVRVPGRLRGSALDAVAIGMRVEIGFEPGPGGFAIPSFLASGEAAP